MKIMIADGGGTKIEWCIVTVSPSGDHTEERFFSEGANAMLNGTESLKELFEKVGSQTGTSDISAIYYYGAGCSTDDSRDSMRQAISSVWPLATIFVAGDMLGAARAMLGDRRGVACILGTGSNACLYSNGEIEYKVPSLGYVLGDHGSGSALGKRLLKMVFSQRLPEATRTKFIEQTGVSVEQVLDSVYRRPNPNKYLASFAPYIRDNINDPELYRLAVREFIDFFRYNVAVLPGAASLPIACCGSIATHFERLLREAASSLGLTINTVVQAPMDGLIAYHLHNLKNE